MTRRTGLLGAPLALTALACLTRSAEVAVVARCTVGGILRYAVARSRDTHVDLAGVGASRTGLRRARLTGAVLARIQCAQVVVVVTHRAVGLELVGWTLGGAAGAELGHVALEVHRGPAHRSRRQELILRTLDGSARTDSV